MGRISALRTRARVQAPMSIMTSYVRHHGHHSASVQNQPSASTMIIVQGNDIGLQSMSDILCNLNTGCLTSMSNYVRHRWNHCAIGQSPEPTCGRTYLVISYWLPSTYVKLCPTFLTSLRYWLHLCLTYLTSQRWLARGGAWLWTLLWSDWSGPEPAYGRIGWGRGLIQNSHRTTTRN